MCASVVAIKKVCAYTTRTFFLLGRNHVEVPSWFLDVVPWRFLHVHLSTLCCSLTCFVEISLGFTEITCAASPAPTSPRGCLHGRSGTRTKHYFPDSAHAPVVQQQRRIWAGGKAQCEAKKNGQSPPRPTTRRPLAETGFCLSI